MPSNRPFCVPDTAAALLDYLEAEYPEVPHLRLYFVTPGAGAEVATAGKYDSNSDRYEGDHVIDEGERLLNDGRVATRREMSMDYPTECDLKAE